MARDFDDVRNAVVEGIVDEAKSIFDGSESIESLVTGALDGCLAEMITTVIDEVGDEDTHADEYDYPAGDVGAKNEAELDQRRADFIAGYNAAFEVIKAAFEAVNNL